MSTTTDTSPEVRICVYVTMSKAQVVGGWDGDYAELEASIKATLHEVVGDDGFPYVPTVLGIDVDED